jgi:hypothetical protein
MKLPTLIMGFCAAAVLVLLEVAVWVAPDVKDFTLPGHLLVQAGILFAVFIAAILLACAEADGSLTTPRIHLGSRAARRARRAAEVAEFKAREARALADREAELQWIALHYDQATPEQQARWDAWERNFDEQAARGAFDD